MEWRFYKFGPWEETCFLRIEPALQEIGAEKRIFSHPRYEDDFVRWQYTNDQRYGQLQEQLPLEITGSLARNVRKFGSDTEGLLHFVYQTPPMLNAAPNDPLNCERITGFDLRFFSPISFIPISGKIGLIINGRHFDLDTYILMCIHI